MLASDSPSWNLSFELPVSETEEIKFCCIKSPVFCVYVQKERLILASLDLLSFTFLFLRCYSCSSELPTITCLHIHKFCVLTILFGTWTNTVGSAILIDDSIWLKKISRKHFWKQEDPYPFWYLSLKCVVFVVCTCTCVNVDVHVSIWTSMWRQVVNIRKSSWMILHLVFWGRVSHQLKTHWLSWGSWPAPAIGLSLPHSITQYAEVTDHTFSLALGFCTVLCSWTQFSHLWSRYLTH